MRRAIWKAMASALAAMSVAGAGCDAGDAGSAGARAGARAESGRTIRVPGDQPTLAAAMAAARPGDTVAVAPGVYRETLALATGVRVVGGPSTIDATGLDHGITADAAVGCCAHAERFTVTGATGSGVFLSGSGGVRLADVTVEGSGNAGALLLDVGDARLERFAARGNAGAGVRADRTRLLLRDANLAGNGSAGIRLTDGRARVERSILSGNGRGLRASHGAAVELRDSVVEGNRSDGIFLDAGDDAADQVRAALHCSGNVVTGNADGLAALASDVESDGDRFDGNRGSGLALRFGAAVRARRGSSSDNAGGGAWVSDVVEFFFCGDPGCTIAAAARAPVRLDLEEMHVDRNGWGVGAGGGGSITVRESSVSGNGGAGVGLDSGFDYDLGDGVLHHEDIPGSITVRESIVEGNAGPCGAVYGTSALDLGNRDDPGESSCAGNATGVVNGTFAAAPVPAVGNWWGTGDAAAVEDLMSGPVAYVPFLPAAP